MRLSQRPSVFDSSWRSPGFRKGRVLSVGDGKRLSDGTRAPHQVSEGDRVLFASHAGTEVVVDDHDLLIVSEDDILAVLE